MSKLAILVRGSVIAGLSLFVGCSSDSASSEDGDDDDANGGSAASSGAGGASGAAAGGRMATGGTAPTGGAGGSSAGGTSGSSAGTLTVRCFDYGDDFRWCYGTPGTDNWGVAWKRCSIDPIRSDPEWEIVGAPAATSCQGLPGLPDDPSGWDELLCARHISSGFVECFGRLGEYWLEIFPDCTWADSSYPKIPGDPAAQFCGAASVANGGWDELGCFNPGGDAVDRCWGRRGAYWVGPSAIALYLNGLTPTCRLDDDGMGVEISPNDVPCPTGGSGGAAGMGGGGGSGAVAGSGGMAGSGGAMNPAECPATEPAPGASCPTTNTQYRCVYGATNCECNSQGQFGCIDCPATLPANGTACVPSSPQVGVICRYGGIYCECRRETSLWNCI